MPEAPNVSHTPNEHTNNANKERSQDNSGSNATGGSVGGGTVLNAGPFQSINNVPSDWSAVDGYTNSFMTNVDAPNTFHSDLNFTSLEFGDEILSTLASPDLERYPTPAAQTKASQTQVDERVHFDSTLKSPAGRKSHDCSREAYDILGSLSFLTLNKAHSMSQSSLGSTSMTSSDANQVPLDHVLCLNREASERLGRLLNCSCARSPHLALLYASIISRVLIWYQQAAGYAHKVSCNSTAMTVDTAPHYVSLNGSSTVSSPRSRSESGGGSSTWSSTTASTFSTGGSTSTPTSTRSTELAVTPATMAIGTFNVDDLRVQTALKIQVLSSEMARAGRLIDQFTAHISSGQYLTDEYSFGGADNLYQGLDSWLRSENSRIANMMKSKLRELNK